MNTQLSCRRPLSTPSIQDFGQKSCFNAPGLPSWGYIAPCNNHPDRHYLLVGRDGEDGSRYFWVTSAALSLSLLRFGFLKKKKKKKSHSERSPRNRQILSSLMLLRDSADRCPMTSPPLYRRSELQRLGHFYFSGSVQKIKSRTTVTWPPRQRLFCDWGLFISLSSILHLLQTWDCALHQPADLLSPNSAFTSFCQNGFDFSHENSFQFIPNIPIKI